MAINLNNNLVGLSMLTGQNYLSGGFFPAVESAAVRAAKKRFTLPETTAPWNEPPSKTPLSIQLSNIRRLPTVIDTTAPHSITSLPDVHTSFVTYKALQKLEMLAEFAAKTSTTASERRSMQSAFARGLADVQSYLSGAKTDALNLVFGKPSTTVSTIGVDKANTGKTIGTPLVPERDAPLPGLTGNEVFTIKIARSGGSETVTVDLSTTPQPPTLDSIAAAFNAAITATPLRDSSGNPVLDKDGNPISRWASRFVAEKTGDKWGLSLTGISSESISLDQVGAPDALLVLTGQTGLDAPASAKVQRINDPAAGLGIPTTIGSLDAVDGAATEKAVAAAASKASKDKDKDAEETTPPSVAAALNARAVVTDADGSSYVVGTTSGDLGSNLSDGADDLFLTKLDSEGRVVWQRTLGAAGEASGAAISLAPNGDIVVAGSVKGPFNGSLSSDSDMLVMRFDANGDELFATSVRSAGEETANSIAVGDDGSIYVGGRRSNGGNDAFLVKLGPDGKEVSRRVIDSGGSDTLSSLTFDASGNLLALTRENGEAKIRVMDPNDIGTTLSEISLGAADARSIAVSPTGEIVVIGSTSTAVPGDQVNGLNGGTDGFVTRINADFTGASTTYIGSDGQDQLDSITFLNGEIYVGGRTTGAISGEKRGAVDGFVGRIDLSTGAINDVSQFGRVGQRTETVQVSAAAGGATALGALGFSRGVINSVESTALPSITSLRAGDSFGLRLNDGTEKTITIEAKDTLLTLSNKISKITKSAVTITTPTVNGQQVLRMTVKDGQKLELFAGPEGSDALAKLGMEPTRLTTTPTSPKNSVTPGGTFGLNLNLGLNLNDRASAAAALDAIKSAVSMTQTAYRSLYWSESNAAIVDGTNMPISGGGTPYQQKQLANYQAALQRLTGG